MKQEKIIKIMDIIQENLFEHPKTIHDEIYKKVGVSAQVTQEDGTVQFHFAGNPGVTFSIVTKEL